MELSNTSPLEINSVPTGPSGRLSKFINVWADAPCNKVPKSNNKTGGKKPEMNVVRCDMRFPPKKSPKHDRSAPPPDGK